MDKENKPIPFGEFVEGYTVPVLNEREIRASAGILFLALLISFFLILFEKNYLLIKYVLVVFLTDLFIRVFISPRFSPTLILGRLIVGRQKPEYVSAAPKRFAWIIGLALSTLMFLLLVILNSYSIVVAASCMLCLAFLFFETAFGICLGCWFYGLLYKEKAQYCAGAACEVNQKQGSQKILGTEILIVVACIIYVMLTVFLFNDYFSIAPRNLKEVLKFLSEVKKPGQLFFSIIIFDAQD